MPRPVALVLAGAAALVLTACGEGADARNTNLPVPKAVTREQQVVQSPGVVEPDLPYATPPLVERIPGPNGGIPGQVPETSGPDNPGGNGESNQK